MKAFRMFLAVFLLALILYTTVTISKDGPFSLFAQFFGDMAEMRWPGQFNFDFMGYLALSAIWVAWRHHFSAKGLGLSVLAFFGGMLFLTIYLLYHSKKSRDIAVIMMGPVRADAL